MQKTACRVLRMTSDQIMTVCLPLLSSLQHHYILLNIFCLQIAEELYTKGFISYPRTETDQFDGNFSFQELITKQSDDPSWGVYAQG